ncbi:MAG: DUF7594 domain-containing protein [Acidimicrobiia bacterium]
MDEHRLPARSRVTTRLRRGVLLLTMVTAVSPWAFAHPVAAVRATLVPEADARVEEANPTRNFGASSTLGADGSPRKEAYLRFSVPAGTGPVTSATLRLRVKDSTDNGPEVRATSSDWNESTITWANRSAPTGGVIADAGKLSSGTWVAYDVTALVRAPGPVAFHLGPESKNGADFASRESGTYRPELIVESTGSGGGGTETAFPAVADTYGDEARPDRNFGSDTTMYVQGGSDPDMASYLRFGVDGLSGPVQRATLRLWVTNGTGNGPAVQPTSGNWTEAGLTWQNRPAPTGAAVADAGAVAKGWAEFDVTPLVTGPGSFNFVLLSGSSDSLGARTSEASAAERPQLVVQTGPAPTTTTTTSTTTTSTTTSTTTTTTTLPPTTTTTLPPTTTTSSTTTTTAPPPDQPVAEAGEPWLGLARLVTHGCEPDCIQSTYSLSVTDVAPGDTGDQRHAFRYAPGAAAVLRLEWSRSADGAGCGAPAATTMEVSLRTPGGGSRIGSTDWDADIPGTCSGALERTIHLDVDPMDGRPDADYYGVMEVFGWLTGGGDTDGADTRGARPADPGDEPGRYARGHLVSGGVMVGWHEDGDDPVLMAANERILGEPFGLVRTYESDWEPPSMRVRNWMAEGKFVLWSVKPPEDAAGHDDWTPVATGAEDAMLRTQVSQLQTWAAAFDTQAGFIFNHEPHDDTDILSRNDPCQVPGNSAFPCSGTAAEFIDIYERLRTIIDALGAQDRVKLVYTATLSWAVDVAPGSAVLGSGDPMTQGPGGESVIDYVDLIAHDSYNWYCFRARCDWEYPDEFGAWGRGVELAETQGKQIIMAETASHPGCLDATPSPVFHCENEDPDDLPGPTRDDWVVRIGTWLESDARARRWILGFAYFHSLHTNDWRFVDQTGMTGSGRDGWRNVFVTDSNYNDALGGHDYFTQYGFNNL